MPPKYWAYAILKDMDCDFPMIPFFKKKKRNNRRRRVMARVDHEQFNDIHSCNLHNGGRLSTEGMRQKVRNTPNDTQLLGRNLFVVVEWILCIIWMAHDETLMLAPVRGVIYCQQSMMMFIYCKNISDANIILLLPTQNVVGERIVFIFVVVLRSFIRIHSHFPFVFDYRQIIQTASRCMERNYKPSKNCGIRYQSECKVLLLFHPRKRIVYPASGSQ